MIWFLILEFDGVTEIVVIAQVDRKPLSLHLASEMKTLIKT